MAKFYGIGVGPGDPELLTVKAAKRIAQLDKIIVPTAKDGVDSVALKIAEEYVSEDAEILNMHFPMTLDLDKRNKEIDIIAEEIENMVQSGEDVGFLVLGDPMLYATYGYLLHRLLGKLDIETYVGINSFSAIASGSNRVLVEHDQPLIVYPCTGDVEKIEEVLKNYQFIVLMKVYKNAQEIKALIEKLGLQHYALISSNFGKETEQTAMFDHFNWENISYFTTILINKSIGN